MSLSPLDILDTFAINRMLRPTSTPVRTSKHLHLVLRERQQTIRPLKQPSFRSPNIPSSYKFVPSAYPPLRCRHLEKADLGSAVRVPVSQSINIRPPQPRAIVSTTSQREFPRQHNAHSTRDSRNRPYCLLGQ